MIAHAKLRYLKASPQKTRLVADQVRGRDVGEALGILKTSPKRVARSLEKLLNSAIANAENREERIDVDRLYVSKIWVDKGPQEKRGRAGTMGRFFPVLKRRSHVTIELDLRKAGS
ncbi:MAG TPA: 50S ribosomal protein L22 [Acidobacteria bacterium]|nr:50S ribosomal protein L22 [Acidobacteriota bacterium]